MDPGDLARLVRAPAVRAFDNERPVPEETVTAIVETARWTGSARNRQPWLIVRVRENALRQQIAELGAYADFVCEAPVLLVMAGADNNFSDTPFDCGRLMQSLLLIATAHGLRGCPATLFPDNNARQAAQLLQLDPGWLPRHVLALGYPKPQPPTRGSSAVHPGRKNLQQIYRDNTGG